MSHHHNHDSKEHHRHGHHHHHEHDHGHLSEGAAPELDKLRKIIIHWSSHNEDHARSYREWAERARKLDREDVALILEEVAESFRGQNTKLEEALELIG